MLTASAEVELIADQLRRVYEGPAWLGPSLKELLSNIEEGGATQRALPRVHTIWEVVLHIAAWMRIGRERLSASKTRDHTDEENWPQMTGRWQNAVSSLESEARALEQAILAFPPERLNDPAPATEPQTFYIMLHGVIQHTAYHAGQIVLLKKCFAPLSG